MRLTLRTLLAWLDDTLSPSEVREIGKQVAESPFAKELVEKIHRVTRQRRLTVPQDKGPEATDPALVARYLDNELDPEEVAELEKKCLVSDVHLAEVASVHQILSLIGQKAKVPTEARHRMYQLIKGREAVKPQATRASRQTEPKPPREQAQPWITAAPPSRPFWEHYGPAAAVLALISVLALTAWKTLSTPTPPQFAQAVVSPNHGAPAAPAKDNKPPSVPATETVVEPAANTPASSDTKPKPGTGASDATRKSDGTDTTKDIPAESPDDMSKPAAVVASATPVAAPPAGSVGLLRKPAGVVLRFNPVNREWDRIPGIAPLREQDRLLNLEPFRSTIELGTAEVDLVGGTEIWARSTPPTEASRLTLAQGRVVLHGTAPSLPFEVQFSGRTVKVTPPPGGKVGVERLDRRAPGSPRAFASVLRIFAADGPTKLDAGSNSKTFDAAGAVTVETDGTFSDENSAAPPRWVTESEPVPYDQLHGEEFLKALPADRPLLTSLVEASEDDQKEVCRLAISALYMLGDISLVVPLLNDKGGPSSSARRKATIAALRGYLGQGTEPARELHAQLQRVVGDELAAITEKLLVGHTPKEAGDEATYAKLVQLLSETDPGQVGIRELALENLMAMTGRDDLDYNPEQPTEGKGLKAWRDLLHAHELKPAALAGVPPTATPKAETTKAETPKAATGKSATGKSAAGKPATGKAAAGKPATGKAAAGKAATPKAAAMPKDDEEP